MKALQLALLLITLLLVTGCAKPVAEVKQPENIGDTVKVRGEVTSVLSIGPLSGYTLEDEAGDSIAVATEDLPQKGDTVTAKGTLRRELFYYIDVDEE